MSSICVEDILENTNNTVRIILQEVTKTSAKNMTRFFRYIIMLPFVIITLRDLKKISKELSNINRLSFIPVNNEKEFHEITRGCIEQVHKFKIRWKKLVHMAPLWNKIYDRIIEITKLFEKIDRMEVKTISKEVEAGVMSNRRIVTSRVPMVISMSVYVFLIITILTLVVLNIIPISAGIIGCILGISFFLTALNDYRHRGQKLC